MASALITPPHLGRQAPAEPSTLVEHILIRIKNNPLIAVLVVLGAITVALATFTDAVTKIFDAIRYNRSEAARKRLLRMSVNFDAKDFIKSIEAKDLHLVKLFLAARMNANVRYDDRTALVHAVMCGDKKIIQALLKAGADVNEGGALACAMDDKKILNLLLEKRPNSETKNKAFVSAARYLDIDSMKILLSKGATLKEAGTEALIDAAGSDYKIKDEQKRDEVMQFLLTSLDPNVTDGRWTPLLRAARYGDRSAVKLLLDKGADINAICHELGNLVEGWTALMLSIRSEHYDIAQLLLEKDVDVNMRNDSGATALIVASKMRSSALAVLPIINTLLDKGADVDAQDNQGYTALMNAVDEGWDDLVHVLLEGGAAVDKKDEKGWTALHFASNKPDIVLTLLDYGADVNAQDLLGMTPLMRAARSGNANVISLLLERGALINTADAKGKTALQFAQELEDPYEKVEATRVLRAAGAISAGGPKPQSKRSRRQG